MSIKKTIRGLLVASFTALMCTTAETQTVPPATPPNTPASNTQTGTTNNALKYANGLHLAYIKTSSAYINKTSEKGLQSLSSALTEKTAVEPEGVVGLDIENDDISLFPVIYWPVTKGSTLLSNQAQSKVQEYINKGGLIVFDIRDQAVTLGKNGTLRKMLGRISIKPQIKMDKDDTLSKTFYLVSSLQGSSKRGAVWIENPDINDATNVTSVIIAEKRWAEAWAASTLVRGSETHKKALQAGINIVMLALTGDYKDDQVHVKSIVEKLKAK